MLSIDGRSVCDCAVRLKGEQASG